MRSSAKILAEQQCSCRNSRLVIMFLPVHELANAFTSVRQKLQLLHDISEGSVRRFLWIILGVVTRDVSELGIARVWKLSNRNTTEYEGKPLMIKEQ